MRRNCDLDRFHRRRGRMSLGRCRGPFWAVSDRVGWGSGSDRAARCGVRRPAVVTRRALQGDASSRVRPDDVQRSHGSGELVAVSTVRRWSGVADRATGDPSARSCPVARLGANVAPSPGAARASGASACLAAGNRRAAEANIRGRPNVTTAVPRSKHVGIVGVSAEGAALCYRTICVEGATFLGPHDHPQVTMHTYPLADYMRCVDLNQWDEAGQLLLASATVLTDAGAALWICPDNTIHQALDLVRDRSP